ncbi:MAG: hypothetical protein HC904_04445, partial [Blastochloris sp.]|nr:hypothetical protein [Blastochloris sp.]
MVDKETLDGTFYNNRILTRKYQGTGSGLVPGRSAGFEVGTSADPDEDYEVTYAYDNAGRLNSVADSSGTFSYTYLTNSNLLSGITGPDHTVAYSYEPNRNVITSLENKVGATTISKYDYTVNRIGQRVSRAQSGTAFSASSTDNFAYKVTGELISADNDTNNALDRAYDYDDIGNRKTVTANSVTTNYTANALNQYTGYTVGGGSTYAPVHDADGNMTQYVRPSDGKFMNLVWDAENRLLSVT